MAVQLLLKSEYAEPHIAPQLSLPAWPSSVSSSLCARVSDFVDSSFKISFFENPFHCFVTLVCNEGGRNLQRKPPAASA